MTNKLNQVRGIEGMIFVLVICNNSTKLPRQKTLEAHLPHIHAKKKAVDRCRFGLIAAYVKAVCNRCF